MSAVETQRIIAVLEETLEKLSFLGSITPDVLAHRDELSQFVGDTISRIIEEQRQLESRYEELIAQRGVLKGLANKSKYKENQHEIQEVSRALRESTKNLCRNLKDNPNISGNLMKIQKEREGLQDLIEATVGELQEAGKFSTLVNKVEEDRREQERIKEVVAHEKETSAAVKQLLADLEQEKADHLREVRERKEEIAKLKEDLHKIKSQTSTKSKYSEMEAKAKTASTLRSYMQEERALGGTVSSLQTAMDVENTVHRDTVRFLEAKHKQLREQTDQWETKYERDIAEKEGEYQELVTTREKDLEELQKLEARWEQELAEKAAKEAEERRLAELERLRKAEAARNNVAAGRIQRQFKKYLVKKAESGGGGKKGKKGKKGKGGGKKKKK